MLHVANINVDSADIVERAACGLDAGFDVLADLPRLSVDIANARRWSHPAAAPSSPK